MNKINSRANSKEILEVCQGIVDLNVKTPIAEDTYYTVTYTKLSERCSKLIEKLNETGLKSVLKEKDDLRDIDVRAIFYEVEAKCNRRSGAQQASALNISATLEQYGIQITSDSYLNESAQVRGVLSDLKSPALAEDVKEIPDLAELITNLEQSQKAFDDSNSEWLDKKSERKVTKPATVLSAECRNIVNDELVVYIAGMSAANPEKYKDFADKMDTIITDINNKVRDRIAAYKRKKETEA